MSQPRLSIIIPAFQEAARIQSTLEQLAAFLKKQRYRDVEVLVVSAIGKDKTAELALAKAHLFTSFKVVAAGPRAGKGRDVRTGMMEAKGQFKLFMDADLATPLHHVQRIYDRLEQNPDIIIGVRDLRSSHQGRRKWLSKLGNWIIRVTLLPGITDSQCGFKLFRHDVADELFGRQRILGWGFDMELLAIGRQRGYRINVIAIPDWHDQPDGTFQNDVNLAALQTLGELFIIIWRCWTGAYRHKHFSYERYDQNR